MDKNHKVIFEYKADVSDEYVILTANAQISGTKYQTLQENFENLKRFFEHTETTVTVHCLVNSNEITIINNQYNIEGEKVDRKKTRKLGPRKSPRVHLVALIPIENLIKYEEVREAKSHLENNEILELDIACELKIEFFTSVGEGISPHTLELLIINIRQVKHELGREKEIFTALKKELESKEATCDEAAEAEQLLVKLKQESELEEQKVIELKKVVKELEKNRTVLYKPKVVTSDMAENQYKPAIELPKWTDDPTLSQRENVSRYISSLENFSKLKVMPNEDGLIYLSLARSNKQSVYDELGSEEKTKLTSFIRYLNDVYGGTELQMRQELDKIRQRPGESDVTFFRRVIRTYLRSRGESETPDVSKINDEAKKSDIKYAFYKGLRSVQVRQLLQQNEANIQLSDLGKTAQTYANVVDPELQKAEVNAIQSTTPSQSDQTKEIFEIISQITSRLNKLEVKDKSCFKCGFRSHIAKDCRASPKTVAAHRRNQARESFRSQSRDRDRYRERYDSRSRERYPRTRYNSRNRDRSRYSKSRSYSRERRRSHSRGRPQERERGRSQERTNHKPRTRSNTPYVYYPRSQSRERKQN